MSDHYDISDAYDLIALHSMHNGVFDKRIGDLEFVDYKNSSPFKFKRCLFENVIFTLGDLSDALFEDCKTINCSFDGVMADKSSFFRCELHNTSFINASLKRSKLTECIFFDADFSKASADKAVFDDSIMEKSLFLKASLNSASFCGCFLKDARFTEAYAPYVDFTMANLTGASLAFGDFSSGDFNFTMMEYSDLRKGDFRSAKFNLVHGINRAIRVGADFFNAEINEKYLNPEN
ncbi:MAG: pentapeptide repeat-containing protein [Candidatus Thiodiazotropha sp. 6PLUC7]